MGDPLDIVDIRPINLELVPIKESPENVSWKNFECSTERKKSLQPRYVYGLIFLLTNILAWLIRDYGHKIFPKLHYLKACGVGGLECSHTNGVLRVSLGIFLLLQLVSVIQFMTWWNNYWMPDSKIKRTLSSHAAVSLGYLCQPFSTLLLSVDLC
ncbi:Serinc-domain containing serine and sphingolipid biosynthesis protein [Thalictrum thalictroides]|uniref:Serinc-domain containing serine and sphingolipid biosynthesis protein n=1 Tax=Thalictrum thalictroides TaxID=46969 RepID=A0A7J6VI14_THATH|nr:Serinc-domain containing serine and sphingolipid biosynthesis protein [Thalictrum thalictroides]